MAKIGTAHVEIKPVLNEEALAAIVAQIEDAIERTVRLQRPTEQCYCECDCTWCNRGLDHPDHA